MGGACPPHCLAISAGVLPWSLEWGLTVGIVVVPPGGQKRAGLGKRREERFVQAFVPEPPVEALDEGVLRRFARRVNRHGNGTPDLQAKGTPVAGCPGSA